MPCEAGCRLLNAAASRKRPDGGRPSSARVNVLTFKGPHLPDSVSISSGIAARYATALFELALEAGTMDRLESNVADLKDALAASEDFRSLISSPVHSREEMSGAVTAIAERMGLDGLVCSTLALMASKRRLFVLPAMLEGVESLLAEHRGVVQVEIVSAQELEPSESEALERMFRERLGKDVKVDISVDASLIGGLSAKIGSRLVDASIRTKLARLRNLMQEVG